MAGSVNKVIIVGNLCRDPEVRSFANGNKVVNLRVATSETWRDKATGERKEKTEFHSVAIFNENLAKIAEQYLRKGSTVYLEGALETRKWQDQTGQDKYSTEIVLKAFRGELTLLGGKADGGSQGGGQSYDQIPQGYGGVNTNGPSASSMGLSHQGFGAGGRPSSNDLDSDIPFSPEVR